MLFISLIRPDVFEQAVQTGRVEHTGQDISPIPLFFIWHARKMWVGYTCYFVYLKGDAMQVAKWGNSLAVRLPATVVEALDLKPGDNIEIHVASARVFSIEKAPGARDLLARLRKYRGRLPADFKFDRIEANERR